MKKINLVFGIIGIAFLLGMGTVSAAPATGFEFHKQVSVNGDWEYDGCWQLTFPTTATYSGDVYSPQSTWADVLNDDNLGAPWQWEGHSRVESNAETDYYNAYSAWTVNPPSSTPGTDWTKYTYHEYTESTNPNGASTQELSVFGFGDATVQSHLHTAEGSFQFVDATVN